MGRLVVRWVLTYGIWCVPCSTRHLVQTAPSIALMSEPRATGIFTPPSVAVLCCAVLQLESGCCADEAEAREACRQLAAKLGGVSRGAGATTAEAGTKSKQ